MGRTEKSVRVQQGFSSLANLVVPFERRIAIFLRVLSVPADLVFEKRITFLSHVVDLRSKGIKRIPATNRT